MHFGSRGRAAQSSGSGAARSSNSRGGLRRRLAATLRAPAPATAAFLSFLLPGVGQAAAGRVRRGIVVAVPAIVIALVAAWVLLFNRHAIVGAVIQRDLLTAHQVVVLDAMV